MEHLEGTTSVGQVKQSRAINQNVNIMENLNFFYIGFWVRSRGVLKPPAKQLRLSSLRK